MFHHFGTIAPLACSPICLDSHEVGSIFQILDGLDVSGLTEFYDFVVDMDLVVVHQDQIWVRRQVVNILEEIDHVMTVKGLP